ncbi:MAG: BlaI/MecI/CopY family transcriptional regulator [Candidatus Korarchaeota archaeon]|nr:BlaI/MecI/CopY family transcriptional regulator [Candidatus Korarchaeota archaeon]
MPRRREPLEPRVMDVLFKRGSATVREVFEELSRERPLSLTTVGTVLSRLHGKGLVEREFRTGRGGVYYVYRPRVSREEYERSVARDAIKRVVNTLGRPGLVKLIEEGAVHLSPEELREILRRIEAERSSVGEGSRG